MHEIKGRTKVQAQLVDNVKKRFVDPELSWVLILV